MTRHRTPNTKMPRPRTALASPQFRRYYAASSCSTFGLWIMRFVLGWTAWSLTESAFWVGLVSGAMLAPTFVLSPVFGVVADRIRLRSGLVATTVSQGCIGLMAATAYWLNWLSIEWLLVLALGKGMITAAHQPLRLSMMPRLIARELLPSGIGLSAMMFNSSRILGPAVGAGLLTVSSTGVVFGASALLFFLASALLLRLPSLPPEPRHNPKTLAHDLSAGVQSAWSSPAIRLILLLVLVNGLHGRSLIELLPAVSGQLLDGGAATLALLTGLAGVGSILGGLLMSRQRGSERRLLRLVYASLLLGALVLIPVYWWQQLWALSAMIFALSLFLTVVGTGCQALVQLLVEDQFRGRILSLWTVIAMGAPALGAFVMGALADWLGFDRVLVVFSVLVIGCTLVLLRYRKVIP